MVPWHHELEARVTEGLTDRTRLGFVHYPAALSARSG